MVAPVGPGGNARFGTGYRRVEPAERAGRGRQHRQDEAKSGAMSRALVPVAAARAEPSDTKRTARFYSDAPFLTQLIATQAGVAQTRARRRAEPGPSNEAYAATARSSFSVAAGMILRRSA